MGKVVEIGWTDAQTSGGPGWVDGAEIEEMAKTPPPVMRTVGYVLHETEEFISLTDSLGPDEAGGVTTIPVGMISWLRVLRGVAE